MIIANVKPGHYLIINENVVIGKVFRNYKYGGKYPVASYDVNWFEGRKESFPTLAAFGAAYDFDNFPGYNAILTR